ncbi:MAG TPA: hypothetical protein VJ725_29640 [Thermoanaerobaculia bacterium]|nr:hypothetical protein [Thermoanaerobaculia bacterium]
MAPGRLSSRALRSLLSRSQLEEDCTQGKNVTDGKARRCDFITRTSPIWYEPAANNSVAKK